MHVSEMLHYLTAAQLQQYRDELINTQQHYNKSQSCWTSGAVITASLQASIVFTHTNSSSESFVTEITVH